MKAIPFQLIKWEMVPATEHPGEKGSSAWKTLQYEGLRVRLVDYSAGYMADHWCRKGHLVHCLEGEFTSQMKNGEEYTLKQGMSYIVSDGCSTHRSLSANGVKLLIIDGDFLKTGIERV